MISSSIGKQIVEAMKARDELRLSTLRMLSSSLAYEKIDKQRDLTEEEEVSVVKREAKKRRDSIEAYEKAGRTDLAEKEKKELVILEEYLPEEMADSDLAKIVDEAVAESGATDMNQMGKVMSIVMQKVAGQADGGRVSALVRERLGK